MESVKHDSEKLRFDTLEPEFIEAMAKVMHLGMKKYAFRNWIGLSNDRIKRALLRHFFEVWINDNSIDEESKQHHLVHVACNCMMLHYKLTKEPMFNTESMESISKANKNTKRLKVFIVISALLNLVSVASFIVYMLFITSK